jgi:hypothetical protein
MARKHPVPHAHGAAESHRDGGGPEQRAGRGETGERFGPVAVARLRKDDGRALILYSHDEDAGDATDRPPATGAEQA